MTLESKLWGLSPRGLIYYRQLCGCMNSMFHILMDMDVVQENKPGDLHTSTLNMTPSKYLQLLPEGLKVSSINSQGIPDLQAAIAQMLQDLELGST